jgi:hypothetical protein
LAFDAMAEVWSREISENLTSSQKAAGENLVAMLDFFGRGGKIIPPSTPEGAEGK